MNLEREDSYFPSAELDGNKSLVSFRPVPRFPTGGCVSAHLLSGVPELILAGGILPCEY